MQGEIERDADGFTVDARIIAGALGLDAAQVPGLLGRGAITTACERGAGEDEGRHRLTFTSGRRRFQLVIDASGNILARSAGSVSAAQPS